MLFSEFKILKHHGKQFVPDLSGVVLPKIFRGRPTIAKGISVEVASSLCELCPSGAISLSPLCIDLGKCIFCKECEFASSGMIKFTNDYRLATNDLSQLMIYEGEDKPITINESSVRRDVKRLFGRSLKLRQVSAAGDNSNEMELNASANVNFDMGRFGIEWVASPRHADGVVITGPISENMAQATQICWEACPEPKILVLVGADAISGGLFADSPALDRSFLKDKTVDLYVPGNPAHPLSFINGLLDLVSKGQSKGRFW